MQPPQLLEIVYLYKAYQEEFDIPLPPPPLSWWQRLKRRLICFSCTAV